MTGNGGMIGGEVQTGDNGSSFVKLTSDLHESAVFRPPNKAWLSSCDLDLGSAGPAILRDSGFLVGGGKEGVLYLN